MAGSSIEVQIPLKDGSDYELSTDTVRALQIRFPHAQVEREVLLAGYWLEKHPRRRPTRPLQFLENWLSKASPKAAMIQVDKWWETEQGTLDKAFVLDIKARPNETWAELRARIRPKEAA